MPLLHKIAAVVVIFAVALGLWLPGDPGGGDSSDTARTSAGEREPGTRGPAGEPAAAAASAGPSKQAAPAPVATVQAAAPAAAAAKANELGQVPVLMYHRIIAKPELSLDRSTTEFREELVRLAKEGYVPITAGEFVTGNINVPAGRHPVVLTFDDSTPGHFALDPQGRPKADTAVAILQDVARQYPGFRATATFYLNEELFQLAGQESAGLKWLLQNGFELGNHTLTHKDLSTLSKGEVQKEIGAIESKVVSLTGTHTATLAYPFGSAPDKKSWAEKKDGAYGFQGIFLAGWRPSISPHDADFDRFAIARVRSEGKIKENDCKEFCSTAWLDKLKAQPATRYTSDGDPRTITFPRPEEDRLAKDLRGRGRVY
ncbi:polysaccharide deacetylase family protein [Actinomadura sp. 9N407]|uniref:polysaccharide deacetylase family protein n=1 Tax=Actinomadura sp. 9N407 TaxID=3375154 RepID=UPI0037BA6220